ncbi:MAG: glycosyltransferase, partial [Jiangellaceae bacterium]
MRAVLAGGGTAGHIEPALATADALRRDDPRTEITMLGTERGLEVRLVPERGYRLALIPPVPLPRRPSPELVKLPARVARSVRAARSVLTRVRADVVVGFGGYVALPA